MAQARDPGVGQGQGLEHGRAIGEFIVDDDQLPADGAQALAWPLHQGMAGGLDRTPSATMVSLSRVLPPSS